MKKKQVYHLQRNQIQSGSGKPQQQSINNFVDVARSTSNLDKPKESIPKIKMKLTTEIKVKN